MDTRSELSPEEAGPAARTDLLRRAALALLMAVVFVAVIYPETFITSFPLIGSEWTSPMTLLMAPVILVTAAIVWRERGRIGFAPADALLLLFFAYVLARNVSGLPLFTVKYVVYGVALYYLAAALSARVRDLRRILVFVSLLVAVTAVYGLAEYAAQANFLYRDVISVIVPKNATHRVSSFLAHPVVFAAFIVQALPFTFLLWVRGWNRWAALAGAASSLMAVACLFLTSSKGSWITAFAAGVVVAVYFIRTRGKKSMFIMLAVFLLAALTAGMYLSRSSLDEIFRTSTSVDVRVASWEAAVKGIKENPVFGVGLKQGEEEVVEQLPDWWKKLTGFEPPVDNYYLNVVLEEGIVGGALWLALMVMILYGGYRAVGLNREGRFIFVAAYLSIIVLALNMLTFDALLIAPNRVLFWVAAGILRATYPYDARTG
ncbi:MAG: O-antigen ligase family protein [Gaiellales bacterium]|nr:MAG: O-antigen ligase family protein [Gaiellales bacterium]